MDVHEIASGQSMIRGEDGSPTFSHVFLAPVSRPFTDAEALAMTGLEPGRVRLEKPREGDCVRQPDGSFLVMCRFTILPDADEPSILPLKMDEES